MKLTIEKLLQMRKVLEAIVSTDEQAAITIDGVSRFSITRNLTKIRGALKDFETVRESLIRKYGKDTGKGDGQYTIAAGADADTFMAEIAEILKQELEVDIRDIKESALTDAVGLPMSLQTQLIEVGLVKD